jgi:hypothetical protein
MFITQLLNLIYRQMLPSIAASGTEKNIVGEEFLYCHVPMMNHNVPK